MLFCKPARRRGIIFEKSLVGCRIYFRSPELKRDLAFLQYCYSSTKIPPEQFYHFLKDHDRHLFIGIAGRKRICMIEIFRLESHELGKQLEIHNGSGTQIFVNPSAKFSDKIINHVLLLFLAYYFNFPNAVLLCAAPGIHDHSQCRLLEQSGFIFHRNIILPSKAASLYIITKKQFLMRAAIKQL